MRGEKEASSVPPPETASWRSPSSALISPLCPSTLSRCHIHERWFLTQINTAAVWMLSGPKLKEREKKKTCRDVERKKWHLPVVSFVAISLAVHLLFPSVKKTAARCTPESQGTGTEMYGWTGSRPICLTVDLSLSWHKMTDKGTKTIDTAAV